MQTHGNVYGDAYHLTIEERDQVYQYLYGRSHDASLVKDTNKDELTLNPFSHTNTYLI